MQYSIIVTTLAAVLDLAAGHGVRISFSSCLPCFLCRIVADSPPPAADTLLRRR